eukprot:CAMPEP_0204151700 /NCGR_PEP_ID=MMETSP0361-20130328/26396_1 /ASSEMBLY_ACC=CAM_ASM_000343 /TAXON_ID=268821 /ORGANISM="Scrippsiella Hangoei, Strain SHTV-5" /LENGTH=104 /DNA_ID=CAMNT_0051106555 /DNA_START=210 /DNA_END=524 /DNA_ORIENTATION=-
MPADASCGAASCGAASAAAADSKLCEARFASVSWRQRPPEEALHSAFSASMHARSQRKSSSKARRPAAPTDALVEPESNWEASLRRLPSQFTTDAEVSVDSSTL